MAGSGAPEKPRRGSPADDDNDGSRRRRAGTLVAIVVAIAIALFLFFRKGDEPVATNAAPPTASSSIAPPHPFHALPPLIEAPSPSSTYPKGFPEGYVDDRPRPEGMDDPTQAPGLNLPPGDFPYPPGSQPITEGVDPAAAYPEDDPVDAKSGVHVRFAPRVGVVHPPDPIIIDLQVLDSKGKPLPIGNGYARFRADGTTVEAGPWFSAPFTDGGQIYSATFLPTTEQQQAFEKGGPHLFVEVHFEAPNGLGPRTYSTVVIYGRTPHASLSGKYSDARTDGNLVIEAGIKVDQAGDYRLIGSLFGPDGTTAIGYAVAVGSFQPGEGTLSLNYFGKILHDKGVDGPYVLRYAMLFERGPNGDDIPGVTVDPAYTTTGNYRASDFSADSYKPPPPPAFTVDPSEADKPPPLVSEEDRKKQAPAPASSH